jgi:hemoglobin-like flavoprotein
VAPQADRKVEVWWSKSREEPDAHKQRHPVNQDQIQIFRGNRVDTIFGAGLIALLFFYKITQAAAAVTMTSTNPIEHSFELAAERCEDLTPLVYRRLAAAYPETLTMFRSEGSELVKGSMLAMTVEAILDFAGERSGKFRMIECEVISHDAYGTPRELFVAFFGVIRDTLRDVLGRQWSRDIDEAWEGLLADIAVLAVPD